MDTKVYIYGLCDVYYDSYYIKGLKEIYKNIEFNIDLFPKFNQGVFAVIIVNKNIFKKIIIDSRDTNSIDDEVIHWCDIYGKINYLSSSIPKIYSHKIIPIGPSFGIRIWNIFFTLYFAIINFWKFRKSIINKREFLANYWRQFNRLSLDNYKYSKSLNNYIFFTSSIWKKEFYTNYRRQNFIKACKVNNKIKFEGGFAPRKDGLTFGLDELIIEKKYSLKNYLRNVKKSSVVFNTPAVLSCHGWKLAEYLALGKAIIATNHINELPEKLIDNFHIKYVKNIEIIDQEIDLIISNTSYKENLEKNARKYFEKYLTPKVVLEKLIKII
ncbi:MAG: hypothetical protein Q7U08_04175 [Flavobacteriaceae bacterium]|nr:hypothetical protein [Flavobacteriaceae bacterium]